MYNELKALSAGKVNSFVWLLIGLIIIWLFSSAAIMGIEIGDGYLTLATSQYFLGLNDQYGFQRGPLLAVYLLPAECLSNFLNLHPLDVRIHHAFTALLHSLYIILVWLLLRRFYRPFDWLVAIAFLATIPSFIFFSYAVFISPDIFPGLILISMILLASNYNKKPNITIWCSLVALGFLAVTIKQTYALFWVAILPACWLFYSKKINLHLFMAATSTALLSWISYAWFLQGAFPSGTHWLLLPFEQISVINDQYTQYAKDDLSALFVPYLYLINFYNYGSLTAILILPAIIFAIFYYNENKTIKIIAIVWVLSFIFMQMTIFKEVRYLAFLTPLSAFILVPFLRVLYDSKHKNIFIALLLATAVFDLSKNSLESLRVYTNFYQGMVQEYFEPIDNLITHSVTYDNKPKFIMFNELGFTPPIYSPLIKDRFHRTFHLTKSVLPLIYNFNDIDFATYKYDDNVSSSILTEGDAIHFSNNDLIREPPWDSSNRATLDENYIQILGTAEKITLTRNEGTFTLTSATDDPRPILLLNNQDHKLGFMLGYKTFDINGLTTLIGAHMIQNSTIEIMGVRINRSCNNNGCFDMDNISKPMF